MMATRGVLEPLPPIEPEDTYLMSESDEEGRSGGGGGGGGGGGEEAFSDSEEEEELSRKRRAANKVSCLLGRLIEWLREGVLYFSFGCFCLICRRGGGAWVCEAAKGKRGRSLSFILLVLLF